MPLYRAYPMDREASRVSVECMDKKQIDSPKMTLNFLIWVGGVFMLLLFGFLAHFVWKVL
jgi:hypothetical protein